MEIVPGIHMVPGTQLSRVYLIEGHTLVLVDTGMPWSVGKVIGYIESIGRNPGEVSHIMMTHSHPDHTSGASSICRLTGAEVIAHTSDTKRHSNSDASMSYMGVYGSLNVPLPFLRRVRVARTVSDGDVLGIGGGIKVIHTPGHTNGSVCYLIEERGIIFSGDVLFSNSERLSRSLPFPGSNRQDYKQSLERLASMDFEILCGGHGLPMVRQASSKLKEMLFASPEPPTWADLFRRYFRRSRRSS